MTGDPKRLLGGYATDSLTEAERQELLRAALGDQKLFDALVEEEGLRGLLADPAARQQVLTALREPRPRERWLAWLWRPATVGDLLAAAAAVVVAVVASQAYRATKTEHVTPAAARPAVGALSQEALERLAALPARTGAIAARLEFEDAPSGAIPHVRPGETLTIRVTAQAPSRAVVLESQPDGKVVQVWPDPRTPPPNCCRRRATNPPSKSCASAPQGLQERVACA